MAGWQESAGQNANMAVAGAVGPIRASEHRRLQSWQASRNLLARVLMWLWPELWALLKACKPRILQDCSIG